MIAIKGPFMNEAGHQRVEVEIEKAWVGWDLISLAIISIFLAEWSELRFGSKGMRRS